MIVTEDISRKFGGLVRIKTRIASIGNNYHILRKTYILGLLCWKRNKSFDIRRNYNVIGEFYERV